MTADFWYGVSVGLCLAGLLTWGYARALLGRRGDDN